MAETYDFSMYSNVPIDMSSNLNTDWLNDVDQNISSSTSPSTSPEWLHYPIDDSLSALQTPDMVFFPPLSGPVGPTPPSPSAPTPASTTSSSTNPPSSQGFACTHPQCKCGGKTFARASELKKHVDRVTRPFRCDSCAARPFATRHDLGRHKREVHKDDGSGKKIQSLCCPVKTCKRSQKGFGRKENLVSHVKRVHGEAFVDGVGGQAGSGEDRAGGDEGPSRASGRAEGEVRGMLETLLREREEVAGKLGDMDQRIEALRTTLRMFADSS